MKITLTITDKKELRTLVINLINKIISESDQPVKIGQEGQSYLMTEFRRVIEEKEWSRNIYFFNDKEREDIYKVAKEVIDWATLQNQKQYRRAGGM